MLNRQVADGKLICQSCRGIVPEGAFLWLVEGSPCCSFVCAQDILDKRENEEQYQEDYHATQ